MSPEQLVALIDFRYISDALPPERALARLRGLAPTRDEREAELRRDGYPAYTTSVGWLGYDDDKIRRLCREALAEGWTRFKLKVGADVEDDRRRTRIVREEIGPGRDAGRRRQPALGRRRGDRVDAPARRVRSVLDRGAHQPRRHPRARDDRPAAVAPIRVATGEHVHNRVMFKQLLQAEAISVCQIDACRLGGVNEVLAVLLMAAEFGVPVCPHAGGVGLCELVQHLSIVDYVCVSGSLEGRMIEYVDHLHEHFLDPVVIRDARYVVPTMPGYSAEMRPESLARFRFPDGEEWRAIADEVAVAPGRLTMRRFGQLIGVRADAIEDYERLHAAPWPGVLDQIRRSNIRNYSIFREGTQLFAYFEYIGEDFEADMAAMAADPETRRWWALTDAMQEPLRRPRSRDVVEDRCPRSSTRTDERPGLDDFSGDSCSPSEREDRQQAIESDDVEDETIVLEAPDLDGSQADQKPDRTDGVRRPTFRFRIPVRLDDGGHGSSRVRDDREQDGRIGFPGDRP